MSQARHIDQNARMVWLSLKRSRMPMSINELVIHWRPVFDAAQIEDCLKRLSAAGHATRIPGRARDAWEVTDDDQPLPDFTLVRAGRHWPSSEARA